jgi:hypothetical protein
MALTTGFFCKTEALGILEDLKRFNNGDKLAAHE